MQPLSYLRGYQLMVYFSLLRARREHPGATFTVMLPRQSGKNEIAATLVVELLRAHRMAGGSIVVCAPTLYPQASLSFERTAALARLAIGNQRPFAFEGNVIRCGRASATFLSASPSAHVAGHTASLLLIADEAQDIDPDWFNRQFRPMTASTGAPTVLFGTPWQGDSLLEAAARTNFARDNAMPGMRYRDYEPLGHFADWERIAKHNPPFGSYVAQERQRLGANHPIFLTQYELRTARAEARLFRAGDLATLEAPYTELFSPIDGERYAGGLDFGGEKAGGDATVLTIARANESACEVVRVLRWKGQPFELVAEEIVATARRWKLERLVCDATGLGGPLTAGLRRELGKVIAPLNFSTAEKSALGFEMVAAAGSDELLIPRTGAGFDHLWNELRVCTAAPTPGGNLRWSAASGAHDDCVVSLALCLRAIRELRPARFAHGRNRHAASS